MHMGIGWTLHRSGSFQYFSNYKSMKSNVILYVKEYSTRREDKLTTSPTDLLYAPQPRRQKNNLPPTHILKHPTNEKLISYNWKSNKQLWWDKPQFRYSHLPSVRGVLGSARSGVLFAHHKAARKRILAATGLCCVPWSPDHDKAHLYFKDHSNSSRY